MHLLEHRTREHEHVRRIVRRDGRLEPGTVTDPRDDDDLVAVLIDVGVGERQVGLAAEQDRARRTLASRAGAHGEAPVDGQEQRPDDHQRDEVRDRHRSARCVVKPNSRAAPVAARLSRATAPPAPSTARAIRGINAGEPSRGSRS